MALAESPRTILFRQMNKPLGQEEMGYIRKRLEEYTDRVRRQIYILNNFDNAVILTDARTLFSYIALLESTIKTQRVRLQPRLIPKSVNQHINDTRPRRRPRRESDRLGLQTMKSVESGSDVFEVHSGQRWSTRGGCIWSANGVRLFLEFRLALNRVAVPRHLARIPKPEEPPKVRYTDFPIRNLTGMECPECLGDMRRYPEA
ncbi:hypothetical protein AJ78_02948 [Emergomyces pasteurianus Ep9510]|uniref:Uncharacterized protein n=1 Tax=Emergomyces pasteurianus Ep9510 TaxID=1447872 RepID=A0A1J9QL46_9EURO|nr:hypothetical protein AJ78_02948 [Emergomyces pasteurianus Ep9510]